MFRRIAAALPGIEQPEQSQKDSILSVLKIRRSERGDPLKSDLLLIDGYYQYTPFKQCYHKLSVEERTRI